MGKCCSLNISMVGIGLDIFITITCIKFFLHQCLFLNTLQFLHNYHENLWKWQSQLQSKFLFFIHLFNGYFFWLVHFFMAQTLYWTNGFLFSRSFYKVLDLDSIGDHPYDLIPWKRVCSKFYKCCRWFLRGGIYMWFVINTIVQKICKYQKFFSLRGKKGSTNFRQGKGTSSNFTTLLR